MKTDNKKREHGIGPMFSFNQLLNTLVTLKQEIDRRTKIFPKKIVPQSIFILGVVILINNSTNLQKIHNFNSRLTKMVSTQKNSKEDVSHTEKNSNNNFLRQFKAFILF